MRLRLKTAFGAKQDKIKSSFDIMILRLAALPRVQPFPGGGLDAGIFYFQEYVFTNDVTSISIT